MGEKDHPEGRRDAARVWPEGRREIIVKLMRSARRRLEIHALRDLAHSARGKSGRGAGAPVAAYALAVHTRAATTALPETVRADMAPSLLPAMRPCLVMYEARDSRRYSL